MINIEENEKSQETVKILKQMIKSDKIPGTLIFEGEEETGRNIIANILAKTIVCHDTEHKKKSGEACGVCKSCVKADKNIHPDIIVSEADGGGALSFHIDKAREIINDLYLSPNESDTKVYIIKDMQNMTPQGQNALLKSIEEPPPFVVFIITVTSSDLILETVKSRAVKFNADYMAENKPAKKSRPIYSDLISDIFVLAENPEKLPVYQKLLSKVFEKSDKIDKTNKAEILNFYSCLENALRDILIAKIFMSYENLDINSKINEISFLYFNDSNSSEEIKKLTNLYSIKKILNLSKKIHKYKTDLDYNINIRLNLTSFLSSLNA